MLNIRTALFSIFTTLSLVACSPEQPKTDLVDVSKTLAKESKAPVASVGRNPKDITLSDRAYTFVDLTADKLESAQPPYYLDMDIPYDKADVWQQVPCSEQEIAAQTCPKDGIAKLCTAQEIRTQTCVTDTKAERAKKWDLKVDGKYLSLNTNNLFPDGNTAQGLAATDILSELQYFDQPLELSKYDILPQTQEKQSKLQVKDIANGAADTFGKSVMFRTTKGDRIVYFQIIDSGSNWVLFYVREQIMGKDAGFKPAQKVYLKYGDDALGDGIIRFDDYGNLRAYFDFDACYSPENNGVCFDNGESKTLNSTIVSDSPMMNWDLFVEVNILNFQGSFVTNGGASRVDEYNTEFDAAALALGKLEGGGFIQVSLKNLWGFSSVEEFYQVAAKTPERYTHTSFGSDGKNGFDLNGFYRIEQRKQSEDEEAKPQATPNQRIYMLETTKREGLLFQVTGVDKTGNVTQVAYKGGNVKQPRQFKIKFRQESAAVINIDNRTFPAILALDEEIVDADTGEKLSEDEFKKIKISIRRINFSVSSNDLEQIKTLTLTKEEAQRMTRSDPQNPENKFTTEPGEHQGVFKPQLSYSRASEFGYEIFARLPGEPMQRWQVRMKIN